MSAFRPFWFHEALKQEGNPRPRVLEENIRADVCIGVKAPRQEIENRLRYDVPCPEPKSLEISVHYQRLNPRQTVR